MLRCVRTCVRSDHCIQMNVDAPVGPAFIEILNRDPEIDDLKKLTLVKMLVCSIFRVDALFEKKFKHIRDVIDQTHSDADRAATMNKE